MHVTNDTGMNLTHSIPAAVLEAVQAQRQNADDLVNARRGSPQWQQLDAMDVALADGPQASFVERHVFTPGLCVRELFMPAGTLLTSRIHLLEHPFVISLGVCSVWDLENGWQLLSAPHTGVTQPGTRRALYVHEDTIWSTFHVTTETDPNKVLAEITYDHRKLGHLAVIPADTQLKEIEQ